ncbi:unnamed protein product [Ceutorhynchus assimilis]|uniref:Protein kinase domain-containing protein n=1 Tax=Ceutorhynchus assimilis TaxID=467358 RepID=A0A9P0DBW5_9CUCU|nr:unnamed protein product [Ceutorhynchus assimilis]
MRKGSTSPSKRTFPNSSLTGRSVVGSSSVRGRSVEGSGSEGRRSEDGSSSVRGRSVEASSPVKGSKHEREGYSKKDDKLPDSLPPPNFKRTFPNSSVRGRSVEGSSSVRGRSVEGSGSEVRRSEDGSSSVRGRSVEASSPVKGSRHEREGYSRKDDKLPDSLPPRSFKWTYKPGGRKIPISPSNLQDLPLLHGGNKEENIEITTPSRHVEESKSFEGGRSSEGNSSVRGRSVRGSSSVRGRRVELSRALITSKREPQDYPKWNDILRSPISFKWSAKEGRYKPESKPEGEGDGKLHDPLSRMKVKNITDIADIGPTKDAKDVDQKSTNQCDKPRSKWFAKEGRYKPESKSEGEGDGKLHDSVSPMKVKNITDIADIGPTKDAKDVDQKSTNPCDKPGSKWSAKEGRHKPESKPEGGGDGKLHDSVSRMKVKNITDIADIGPTKDAKDVDQKSTNQCDKPWSKWTYVPGGRKISWAPLNQYYLPLLYGDDENEEMQKITPSGPVEASKPEGKCSLEIDDKPKEDVDQNSTNHSDESSHESALVTASEELVGEVDLRGLDKENIPPKKDDSFDYDIYPPMAPVKSLEKPCVLQTPKSLKIPTRPAMPSLETRPYVTSTVEWECLRTIVHKGSDGFDRISVNDMEYIVYHKLGHGGMSAVYCGFNQCIRSFVAIKVVRNFMPNESMNEVKILKSVQNCDKIIKMYDYEIKGDKLVIVFEKGGPDFGTILKQRLLIQKRLPNYMILFYWLEMLHAVKQLHSQGIIHTDLKPANFLRNGTGLKLIDFGIASRVGRDTTFAYKSCQEGTFKYISPEAVMKRNNVDPKQQYKIHFKSDVWSLGCILYQLVYGHTPFNQTNITSNLVSAISDPDYEIDYPEAEWAPKSFVQTMKKCLQFDIAARPSVDELIQEYEEKILNDF